MTDLSPEEMHVVRHALGADARNNPFYRNWYYTEEGSYDYDVWQRLFDRGMASIHAKRDGRDLTCFSVTEKGMKAADLYKQWRERKCR